MKEVLKISKTFQKFKKNLSSHTFKIHSRPALIKILVNHQNKTVSYKTILNIVATKQAGLSNTLASARRVSKRIKRDIGTTMFKKLHTAGST